MQPGDGTVFRLQQDGTQAWKAAGPRKSAEKQAVRPQCAADQQQRAGQIVDLIQPAARHDQIEATIREGQVILIALHPARGPGEATARIGGNHLDPARFQRPADAAIQAAQIERPGEGPLDAVQPVQNFDRHARMQEIMPGETGRGAIAAGTPSAAIEDFRRGHGWRLCISASSGTRACVNPLRAVIDFALPPRCPACGTIVASDDSFCEPCWSKLDFLGGPACAGCGVPFDTDRGEDVLCGACLADPPAHDGVRAVVAYGDVARSLVLKLKHGRRIGMARTIGRHMARGAAGEDGALLLPVPLHRWRIWRRGFNQSALLAREIGRRTGLEVDTGVIDRRKPTPMLGGLGRAARARALRGAFAIPSGKTARIAGRTVLLVDDVYTSGATAGACVKVLKRAGAAKVIVLCWARVLQDHVDDPVAVRDEPF